MLFEYVRRNQNCGVFFLIFKRLLNYWVFFQHFIMKIYKHRNITRTIYMTHLPNNYVQQYLNNLPPFLYYTTVFLLKHFRIGLEQHSASHIHDLAEIS